MRGIKHGIIRTFQAFPSQIFASCHYRAAASLKEMCSIHTTEAKNTAGPPSRKDLAEIIKESTYLTHDRSETELYIFLLPRTSVCNHDYDSKGSKIDGDCNVTWARTSRVNIN